MPTENEILAVERALARLYGSRLSRKEATEVVAAAEEARRPIDRATQIPPPEGESELCQCPLCGRNHWRLANKPGPARERMIGLDAGLFDRLNALRGAGQSLSDVISQLVGSEARPRP